MANEERRDLAADLEFCEHAVAAAAVSRQWREIVMVIAPHALRRAIAAEVNTAAVSEPQIIFDVANGRYTLTHAGEQHDITEGMQQVIRFETGRLQQQMKAMRCCQNCARICENLNIVCDEWVWDVEVGHG